LLFQFSDDINVKYQLKLTSRCGPAYVFLANKPDEELPRKRGNSAHTELRREPSTSYGNVTDEPGDILENEEEYRLAAEKRKEEEASNNGKTGVGFRSLSPPPSERDYIYGLSQGESLFELYDDDGFS
jgi:hypothetical protein